MKRVLIADDDERLRALVRLTLDTGEVELLEAADGDTALAVARAEQPDVVLLDWAMPRLAGIDVCRRLKADPATAAMKVVMLTGRTLDFDRRAAVEAGVDGYIVKPFSPFRLLNRIGALLA